MSTQSLILVLSSLGLAQALFLCFYLFTLKKGNRRANAFLALMLLGLTIRIGKSVLNVYLVLEPWQRNLGLSGILIVGPFLWFYGRLLLGREKRLGPKNGLHLLPFGLFVLLCAYIPNTHNFISYGIYIMVFTHLASYILISTKLLLKHRTYTGKQLWAWYRNLIFGVGLVWLFYMGHLSGIFPFYIGGAIFFSLLVYILSFLLLKKPVFTLEKYRNSTIDIHTSQRHIQRIKNLFKEEHSYLNNDLNLNQVAEKLSISPRELSQVINENEHKNFSEFVNGYRIQKAKRLLVDPGYAQEKIATIAYDCGFGNVTSFNLAFKAETESTPSQYRNKFSLA
ncbi:MAG: helix-turn-helix domain-containing protein [Saonia sp.]